MYDEGVRQGNKTLTGEMIMITINRTAVEKKFGGRGGIELDLRFAICEKLSSPDWDRWTRSESGDKSPDWDVPAIAGGTLVRIVRLESDDVYSVDGETAEVTNAVETAVGMVFSRWQKHCDRHSASSCRQR